jgi:hypothetical protein
MKTMRRVPRVAVDFPAIIIFNKNRLRCLAQQLSEFGIFVNASEKRLIGKRVQVEIKMSEILLSLSGIVAYGTDAGIGIRFTDVPIETEMALRGYVRVRSSGVERSFKIDSGKIDRIRQASEVYRK